VSAELIERSLERVAERVGDPADLVYQRLFDMAPELKDLFLRDTDGSVRGEMLHRAFETILDLVGDDRYAEGMIATEWVNHQNVGVPPQQFELFFVAMTDTFRGVLGEQWTPEVEGAWQSVNAKVSGIIARLAQAA
jgi:hemoglobin-like flavoprotein